MIGPPRSGTTLVGTLLSYIPESVYVEEPNFVWRVTRPLRQSDFFSGADANFFVRWYIRRFMSREAGRVRAKILVEKTPANCLRLDYIKKIFPDAFFVFVIRNSADVAVSMEKKWRFEDDSNSERLRGLRHDISYVRQMYSKFRYIPAFDFPFYICRIFREAAFHFVGKERKYWGVRVPGGVPAVAGMSIPEVCALQAEVCFQSINAYIGKSPSDNILLRYEDFVRNPEGEIEHILKRVGAKISAKDLLEVSGITIASQSSAEEGESL